MADPLAQYFDPKDPLGNFFDQPQNGAEELRAKRVTTASPQELRRIHAGNVLEGTRQDQRSIVGEAAEGAFVRGPAKALGSIPELPNLLYQSVAQPAQVGKQVSGAPAEIYRKLSSGTPTEVGEAAFDVGSVAIPAAKGLGAGAKAGLTRLETKAGQVLTKGANRSKSLTYGALSEGIGHRTARAQRLETEINKGLEPVFDFAAQAKRKINNVEDLKTVSKDMTRVTDAEFNQAVESVGDRMVSGRPIAEEIRKEITDLAKTTNPGQAENLERIAASFDRDMPISEVNQLRQEANNVLDKFYAKSPLQQEHPAIGIAAQSAMADGLRGVLYDNLEQMFPDSALRQMMRERGAAEGISKFASESSGGARRKGMAEAEVGGVINTPLTKGTKLARATISPRETLTKGVKYLQRPDKKIQEAFKLYIPKKSTIAKPIGQPGPHGLPPQGPTPDDLLQNAGGQIRYNPSPQSSNVLSPEFQPNPNLDPAVMEQWRAQSAQGPNRGLTIGEAASQGVDVPLSQTLKYQGYPGSAAIDETIERTTQFPLARSRPGERGSFSNRPRNALEPLEEEVPRWKQQLEAQRRDPAYADQLRAIGLTEDEIRIKNTPRHELNEVEKAIQKEVRQRVFDYFKGGLDSALSDLSEGVTNEAVKFNANMGKIENQTGFKRKR